MTLSASVRIDRLTKTYGSFKAVDDVSLSIAPGEFVSLLGASGSGKTTTLMALAGFVIPDSGNIFIDDKEISSLTPEARGLGVVFQSYALFPHYDVFENVAFPLRLRHVGKDEITRKVAATLKMVGLGPLSKRRISELSGGQQQRVALARAIVFSPPVLLMDEPLGALDRKLREQLQVEIKRVQTDLGVTVVYVTHDQEEALAMSDRIAIMQQGRIAQIGSPDEIYGRPTSPFVAGFLGESNFVKFSLISEANGIAQVASTGTDPQTVRAVLADGAKAAPELIGMIRPEAIRLRSSGCDQDNTIAGTIIRREFLGPSVRLTIASGIGELALRLLRIDNNGPTEAGTPVSLTWRPKDMILFPDDGTSRENSSW